MENETGLERNRIEISAIVIALYTTLIFAIPNLFPAATAGNQVLGYLLYNTFVGMGCLIDLFFFLYILFYALELKSIDKWPKEIWPGLKLDEGQISRTKKFCYDFGVNLIFFSLFLPIAGLPNTLQKFTHLGIARSAEFGLGVTAIFLLIIQIIIVFTRTKKK